MDPGQLTELARARKPAGPDRARTGSVPDISHEFRTPRTLAMSPPTWPP